MFQFVSTNPSCSNALAHPILVISGRNGRPLLLLRCVSRPLAPPVPSQLTSPISFGRIICRDRFSTAARIGIAVASFVVIFAILLAYSMYRRRRAARANIAVVHAPQSQQQGYPDQYPPLPQGGFLGTPPGGNGQKAQQGYDPQPYNGQYNPQYNDQYGPQYNGQYNQPYNSPQYPPATYDQGQPVSTIPISGSTSFHPRLVGAPVPWLWATARPSPSAASRVENRFGSTRCTIVLPAIVSGLLYYTILHRIHDDLDNVTNFARDEERR